MREAGEQRLRAQDPLGRRLKVAFIGTHGVGKTTLCFDDCVTGPDVLVRAAAHGKRAAEKIDSFLRGMDVKESEEERLESLVEKIKVYDKGEKIGITGGQKRAVLKLLPPETRKWIFDEAEQGFSIPDAQKEAERCLRCVRIGLFAT